MKKWANNSAVLSKISLNLISLEYLKLIIHRIFSILPDTVFDVWAVVVRASLVVVVGGSVGHSSLSDFNDSLSPFGFSWQERSSTRRPNASVFWHNNFRRITRDIKLYFFRNIHILTLGNLMLILMNPGIKSHREVSLYSSKIATGNKDTSSVMTRFRTPKIMIYIIQTIQWLNS